MTELERSCTKYLLCLVLQVCVVHLVFVNKWERREVCLVSVTTVPAVGWHLVLRRGTFQPVVAAAVDVPHWCRELGRQRSVIELDTPSMNAEQVEALERSVNEKIRERLPVVVRELAADDPEIETVSGEERAGDIHGTEITVARSSPGLPLSFC